MNNNRGMTLLEVLIGMLITSIGLMGLAPLLVVSMDANKISQDVMTICDLAEEKLELYQDGASLPMLPYSNTDVELEGTYDRYTRIWDNTTDTLVPPDVAYVQVTISWDDQTGPPALARFRPSWKRTASHENTPKQMLDVYPWYFDG